MRLPGTLNSSLGLGRRGVLLVLAVGTGGLAAAAWNPGLTNWAYNAFLGSFLDPGAQIAYMGIGVALGFLTGVAHITAI